MSFWVGSVTTVVTLPAQIGRVRTAGVTLPAQIGAAAAEPGSYDRGVPAKHGEPVEFEIAGKTVAISSPGKVMFPERGETKLDLANYYVAVGDALMNTVRDR